jgi:hypothetical protein
VKQISILNQCNKAIKAVKDGTTDRGTLIRLIQPLLNQNQNVNQFLDMYVGSALIEKLENFKSQQAVSGKQSPKHFKFFRPTKEQKKKI